MTIKSIKAEITGASEKAIEEIKAIAADNPQIETVIKKLKENCDLLCDGVEKKYYGIENKSPKNLANMVYLDDYKGDRKFAKTIISKLE